jgi:transcriptional regulator with XRE-family HTH domain
MESTSRRMFDLRTGINITQARLAQELSISQSAINRYEHNDAAVPDNVLLKYADFFDVSADYILGRCDEPQGKKYDYQPEYLKNKLASSGEWREFVEMCFDPGSPINSKLKEMIMQMAGGDSNADE